MKPQTTGLLLCALLMSTFGHELLARHHVAHSLRHHAHSPLLARSDKPTDNGNSTNLTVSINVTTEIIIVANLTAHIAIVTDVKANLVGLFCESTGAVIIVDLKTQTGIYVPASSSSEVWNKSEGIDAFIQSITSLTVIQQRAKQHCTKFDSNTITAEISQQIHLSLIAVTSGDCCADRNAALLFLVQFTVSLIASLQIGILKVIEGGVCTAKTLQGLTAVFQGLTLLIGELEGGISAIIESKIKLDLAIILSAVTAAEAFIHILTQLNGHVNLKGCFKNYDTFLKLLAALGGNCTHGPNGVLTVLVEVVALIHSQTTIEAVIAVLLKFGAASSSDNSLSGKWSAGIEKLIQFCEQQQLSDILITRLKAIQSNSAQEGGINLSAIITALLAISSDGVLRVVVMILVLLKAKIAIELSILALVLALVKLLTSVAGVLLLVAILGIEIKISIIENIVADIVKALDAIVNVTVANVLQLLGAIPILGAIIKAVVDALISNALNLTDIIKDIGIEKLLAEIKKILTGGQATGGVTTSDASNTTAGATEEATTTQATTIITTLASEGKSRHVVSGINGHGRREIGRSRHGGVHDYVGKHHGHEKHNNKI